ncbi:hypothetical protein [Algoriphagus pacificus]|uniref:Glycosyltransferase n=1 Tax=Algoriphagus pacificus TaxID=2811234 RepID=A0ABS3CKK1_9BACT|nr:hypothetical protein [Algoriphagus pacificus]MBN7817562.1 hypothetical protein [Algoriphagus pacificus]
MTLFEKIQAKSSTYLQKLVSMWFRLVDKVVPNFFNVQTVKASVFHLGYGFPDENFLTSMPIKTQLWAEVIPGMRETYRFSDEDSYHKMYADARFAFTWKKGGWDCLRHYEILANGTIPVFPDLSNCPQNTLSHLPKELIIKANKELLPWKENPEYKAKYQDYLEQLLDHSRKNASTSAIANRFLQQLAAKPTQKILFLNCDVNVNYSRELLFIGLNKVMNVEKGICLGYPKLDFLYTDYPLEKANKCYGKGFGYTRRIEPVQANVQLPDTAIEIENSIRDKEWDFIIYGKMGVDEGLLGSAPTCPFWETVSGNYPKENIAFIYGGDSIQDLTDVGSIHTRHLLKHAKLGKCFVRELKLN